MNINNLKLVCFLLSLLSLQSCGDFSDDLYKNPSTITTPFTKNLITGVLRNLPRQNTTQSLYIQHLSQIQYTSSSRYTDKRFNYQYYYLKMTEIQKIIDLNSDDATKEANYVVGGGTNANQIAFAKIIKAYFLTEVVSKWGPVPYSEATKGNYDTPIFNPKFDSEESIYTAIFNELKAGAEGFDANGALNGDILFGGDKDKWKKFAHSIRVINAMRLADIKPDYAKTIFNESIGKADLQDDIEYTYLTQSSDDNPWYASYLTRTDYGLSKLFIDKLKALGDPRLEKYASKSKNNKDYNGMPYGLASPSQNADDISLVNPDIRKQDSPLYLVTKAQILFTKAEAVERGWMSGDAEKLYTDAIKASFDQWGVTSTDDINAFLANEDVKYDKSKWKEKIGLQKWIALFLQGNEAWSEWRRLNNPKLSPPANDLNSDGGIPVRLGYPSESINVNKEQYEKGVDLLKANSKSSSPKDNLSTRLWWDTDKNDGE